MIRIAQPLLDGQLACTDDPDLFFGPEDEPDLDRKRRTAAAEALCAQCPVRSDCLADALGRRERHGVWGGVDLDARRVGRPRGVLAKAS